METRSLHNPVSGDSTLFCRRRDGILLEEMRRPSHYDMRSSHFHQEYEIYLLVQGRRQIFFDNRAYLAEAGSLILVDSGQIHMSHSVLNDPDPAYERIILYLDRDKVRRYDEIFPELHLAEFLHSHYGIYALSAAQFSELCGTLRLIMREMEQPLPRSRTLVDLKILEFFIAFWREKTPVSCLRDGGTDAPGKYTAVYAAADYISDHFTAPLTLDELAARTYLSKFYLSRSFREVTGVGIRTYINLLRLQKARGLLLETALPVSAVAEAVGFESLSYFERIFKRHFGTAPAQFRKNPAQDNERREPDESTIRDRDPRQTGSRH
ncbi:MAG: AraC family transcriptional regulator [Gemmiger sp.]|uniref:helix-turn-helix transcriptional regulator n=1 Tax=Gemmiger sp. TaxID=2049027 RepID=UPI002E79C828|nr:AraC family transcriptional regulator [Gemmiger sp.]MEE0799886.1 AraC family transcriptional regulator [Gemmiger sp.]